jgi:hypothetical protein
MVEMNARAEITMSRSLSQNSMPALRRPDRGRDIWRPMLLMPTAVGTKASGADV